MNATNEDFAAVFTSPRGALVLETLQIMFDRSSYVKPPTGVVDPYEMAYNEGRRAVLTFIHNNIKTSLTPKETNK